MSSVNKVRKPNHPMSEEKRKRLENQGAKVRVSKEEGVKPTYYIGDVKSQVKSFQTYTSLYNNFQMNKGNMFDCVPDDYFVNKALKRIARHYGYDWKKLQQQ